MSVYPQAQSHLNYLPVPPAGRNPTPYIQAPCPQNYQQNAKFSHNGKLQGSYSSNLGSSVCTQDTAATLSHSHYIKPDVKPSSFFNPQIPPQPKAPKSTCEGMHLSTHAKDQTQKKISVPRLIIPTPPPQEAFTPSLMSPRIKSALESRDEVRSNPAIQIQLTPGYDYAKPLLSPAAPKTERAKNSFTRNAHTRGNSVRMVVPPPVKSGFKRKGLKELKGSMVSPSTSPRRLLNSILTKTERTLENVAKREQSRKQADILSARDFQNIGRSGWDKEAIFEPKGGRAPLDCLQIKEMASTASVIPRKFTNPKKRAWVAKADSQVPTQCDRQKCRVSSIQDNEFGIPRDLECKENAIVIDEVNSEENKEHCRVRMIREDTGGTEGLLHVQAPCPQINANLDNEAGDSRITSPHLESEIARDNDFEEIEGDSFIRGESPLEREIANMFHISPGSTPPIQHKSILDDPIISMEEAKQSSSFHQSSSNKELSLNKEQQNETEVKRRFRERKRGGLMVKRAFQNQELINYKSSKAALIQQREQEICFLKYQELPLIQTCFEAKQFQEKEVRPLELEPPKPDFNFEINVIEPAQVEGIRVSGLLSTLASMELQGKKKKRNSHYCNRPVITIPAALRSKPKSIRHVFAGGPSLHSQSTLKNESQFTLDSFKRRPSIAPFSNSNMAHNPPALQNRKSSKYTPRFNTKDTGDDSETECDSPFYGHTLLLNQDMQRMRFKSFASPKQEMELLLERVAAHQLKRLHQFYIDSEIGLDFLKQYFRATKENEQLVVPPFKEEIFYPIDLHEMEPLLPFEEVNDFEVFMAEIEKYCLPKFIESQLLQYLLTISKEHFDKISNKPIDQDEKQKILDIKGISLPQERKRSSLLSSQSVSLTELSSEKKDIDEWDSYLNVFTGGKRSMKEERYNQLFVYYTIQQHFPQLLNERRISHIFASWFEATNSENPETRCNILLHSPKLRSEFFACLAKVEHSLSLQEMLKSPRRLSTDRLVRKGRRSLQPCLLQRAALQNAVIKVINEDPPSPKEPYPVPSLPVSSRQSGQDLAKWGLKEKNLRNCRSIERSETSSNEVFMLTVHSIQRTVSVKRGDFQKHRFQRFKAHYFISSKLSNIIEAIVPIRLLKEHSLMPSMSDSMLDPSLLSAMSASFKQSPSSSFSSNKPLTSKPTAPRIQISHTDTSKLDQSDQSLLRVQKWQKKRRGSRTPNLSSFGPKLLEQNESEQSSSFSSFTSTSSEFSELAKTQESPPELVKTKDQFGRGRSISPIRPSELAQIINLEPENERNQMARLAVPSYKAGYSEGEEINELANISEQDEIDMEKSYYKRPRIKSYGESQVKKLLPKRVVRSRTNKSLEIEKIKPVEFEKKGTIKRFERRKTGFNDNVRTLKKKQTWFESNRYRRTSIEFSSTDRVFEVAKKGDLLPLKAVLKQYVGFEINQRNTEGLALLHLAVQQGSQDIVTFLLRKGAKVNIRDVRRNINQQVDGNTPMHYAVSYQHHALINVLIDAGASQRECNLVGKTPWEGL